MNRLLSLLLLIVSLSHLPSFPSARGASITLGWDASTSSNIVRYSVWQSAFTNAFTRALDAGLSLSATLPLSPGSYRFYVTAQSTNQESAASNILSAEIPDLTTKPLINFEAVTFDPDSGTYSLALGWTASPPESGASYIVRIVLSAPTSPTITLPTTETSITRAGLAPGMYRISVAPVNALGEWPASDVLVIVIGLPNAPKLTSIKMVR